MPSENESWWGASTCTLCTARSCSDRVWPAPGSLSCMLTQGQRSCNHICKSATIRTCRTELVLQIVCNSYMGTSDRVEHDNSSGGFSMVPQTTSEVDGVNRAYVSSSMGAICCVAKMKTRCRPLTSTSLAMQLGLHRRALGGIPAHEAFNLTADT